MLHMDDINQCVLVEDFLAKVPLFPKCVCLYPAHYNAKCLKDTRGILQFLLNLKYFSKMLFSPFLVSRYLCLWGSCRQQTKRMLSPESTAREERDSGSYFRWPISLQYRLLLSEAGNVPDTQLGIALLRQKPAVIKPDSWHTQANSQLFVRVTLFVLMLVIEERKTDAEEHFNDEFSTVSILQLPR